MHEQLLFAGASFRSAGFGRLGRYVLAPATLDAELRRLRDALGADELVYVATCNRVEVYARVPGAPASPESALDIVTGFFGAPREDFVARAGEGALDHLFSVVASLDSLVLGECEIAGQVRRAIDAACAAGHAGPYMRRLFEKALRVARRVRLETAIGETPVSVASLVARGIKDHFAHGAPVRAALIGVNDVTRKIAGSLERAHTSLLFVNRTESRAAELASRHGGAAMSLDAFRAAPPADLDLVVSATRAPEPVVRVAHLAPSLARPRTTPLLVCDLGVPPDVDAAVAAQPGVVLLRLDDLEAAARENRERRAGEVPRARAIVREEVLRCASAPAVAL